MRLTGERVVSAAGGLNPTWQRHVAAYSLVEAFLPPGPVLDVGCGIGHSYHLLAPRRTVGLDLSTDALRGQRRPTVNADMRRLPVASASVSSVVSVQSLEHVPDPELVVAEVARVVGLGGTAIFVTPNRLTLGRPDEIIDPYHFKEFDHLEIGELCRAHFGRVRVVGLFGSPRYMEIVLEERARLEGLLRRDPLRLRRVVPIRAKQWLYDTMLTRQRGKPDPRAEAIEVGDFELRDSGLLEALDVCAICEPATP